MMETSRPPFETMDTPRIWMWLVAHYIEVDLKSLKTLENLRSFANEKYNEMLNRENLMKHFDRRFNQ